MSGHLCAAFITIFGGYAVLDLLHFETPFALSALFVSVGVFALIRGILRYAEQACNHFIAFKLLALIRDKVFQALRKLCPAKLEGRDKGDLISVITSDIELLEVFYAHTISPAAIAVLFTDVLCLFIGSYHPALGLLALVAYITVGLIIPLVTSKLSGDDGIRFRTKSGDLSSFVLDSLRGLSETIQYGQGKKRLCEMNARTDELSKDESRMKRTSGRNMAVTNTAILIFNLKGKGMTWKTKIRIMITVTLLMSIGFTLMLLKGIYIPCAILAGVWVFHIFYFAFGVKTIKEKTQI